MVIRVVTEKIYYFRLLLTMNYESKLKEFFSNEMHLHFLLYDYY